WRARDRATHAHATARLAPRAARARTSAARGNDVHDRADDHDRTAAGEGARGWLDGGDRGWLTIGAVRAHGGGDRGRVRGADAAGLSADMRRFGRGGRVPERLVDVAASGAP